MNSVLLTAAHYLLGWGVLAIALSWLAAVIYPNAARLFAKMGSAGAAFYTLLLALIAPFTALITIITLSSPTLTHLIVEPHCHGDICEPHSVNVVIETMLSTVMLAMGVAALIVVALIMASQLITNLHRSRMLEQLSELDESGYLRFESPNRIAWCFGLFKPTVILSSGMIESLSEKQRQIVLARELAHASQYDNLRKWLVKWATIAWPKNARQHIRHDFSELCETSCDLKAFSALSATMETATYMDTLRHVYGAQTNARHDASQTFWQRRLEILRREFADYQNGSIAIRLPLLMAGGLGIAIWLVIVATSVYVGHPLLENLL